MKEESDWEYIRKLQQDSPPEESVKRFTESLLEIGHSFTGMLVSQLLLTGKFKKVKPFYRLDNKFPFFKKDNETAAYRIVHVLYRLIIIGVIFNETINWNF